MSDFYRGVVAAFVLTIATPVIGSAHAQTNARTVSIAWSGNQPSQVYIDRDGTRDTLHLDDQQGVFTRTLQIAEPQVAATIAAEYSSEETASLPVYLLDRRPTLSVTFHRATSLPCSHGTVTRLEQSSNNFQTTLQAYFDARALALRTGPNRCGSAIRPRVIKAWYDRSYDLAGRNPNFRIDPDAEREFNGESQLTQLHPNYTALYARRLDAAELRWTFADAVDAGRQQDFRTSALLLRRIQVSLATNDELRRDTLAFEDLSTELVSTQLVRAEGAMQPE